MSFTNYVIFLSTRYFTFLFLKVNLSRIILFYYCFCYKCYFYGDFFIMLWMFCGFAKVWRGLINLIFNLFSSLFLFIDNLFSRNGLYFFVSRLGSVLIAIYSAFGAVILPIYLFALIFYLN